MPKKGNFIRERLLFLSKFLRNSRNIGSIVPSGKALSLAASKYINPAVPQIIIEVGAGTGATTKVAVAKMHPDSTYIAVEKDPELAQYVSKYCPQVKMLICDVEHLTEELEKINIHKADVFISCLPFFNLPAATAISLLNCYQKVTAATHAPFCQQTLIPWHYQKMYRQIFNKVEFELVPINIPPGGYYYCADLRPGFKEYLQSRM